MSDHEQGQSKRFRLKGWYVIVAVIVAVVGLIVLYSMIMRARLNRRLEALRAAGYPTTVTELAAYNKLPDGVANAADAYAQAFAAFSEGPSGLAERLAANRQCLSLLHEAGGIQDCDYDWDWRKFATTGFSEFADVRHCAQLLGSAATYHASTGDSNAAATCIEDGLRLVDSLRREPALLSYLVRTACTGLVVHSLAECVSTTVFTDEQLTKLDKALAATAAALDLTQALITERCVMIESCRNPFLMAGPGGGSGLRMLPGMARMGIADTLDYMNDCIEASKLPPKERLARFHEAAKRVDEFSAMHVMIKLLAPALGRVAGLSTRSQAGVDLARTALAIERYRLATGKLPERLEELVPQYLNAVPIDPFDGQPIRYHRSDLGYRLYHIGEDGQDNSGKGKDEVNRGDPYDWPFIVTR